VHKDFACIVTNPSCFGQSVTMDYADDAPLDGTRSKFGLLDLDRNGNAGTSELRNWIEDGYPGYLPVDTNYPAVPGNKNGLKKALEDAADAQRTLLFPVFDTATGTYHVIGWAAFIIDDVVKWTGQSHQLKGRFVTFIATDLAGGNTISDPSKDFGVHVITLTK
jgi:hypothetical protein